MKESIVERIKWNMARFADFFELFVSLPTIGSIVPIYDQSFDIEFAHTFAHNFFGLSLKKEELTPFFLQLIFEIFERFNHKFQAMIASKRISLDLFWCKNEGGNDNSEDFNAKMSPVLSSSRKSRLNKKRDLRNFIVLSLKYL